MGSGYDDIMHDARDDWSYNAIITRLRDSKDSTALGCNKVNWGH